MKNFMVHCNGIIYEIFTILIKNKKWYELFQNHIENKLRNRPQITKSRKNLRLQHVNNFKFIFGEC